MLVLLHLPPSHLDLVLFLLQLLKELLDLKAEVLVLNRQLLVGNPFCLQFSLALGML